MYMVKGESFVCSEGKKFQGVVIFPDSHERIGRPTFSPVLHAYYTHVSRDEVEGNIRTQGKTKLTSFLRDHTLSVSLYV